MERITVLLADDNLVVREVRRTLSGTGVVGSRPGRSRPPCWATPDASRTRWSGTW
ncbi:MAG: hypothetical protein H7Y15_17370 [Pseudonocardia sp.]|nr:hypothetical protein [Pseudonocardia sp.]